MWTWTKRSAKVAAGFWVAKRLLGNDEPSPAPAPGRRGGDLTRWVVGAVVGALAAYLLDPEMGRTRRARMKDQTAAAVRSVGRRMGRTGRRVSSDAKGKMDMVRYRRAGYEPPNDATLAHKVETELFGRPEVPKGSIVVTSERGVVDLRGEVEDPGQVEQIERVVREIPGVREVRNLLHPPGTPAPDVEDARESGG